ncbi:MAG: hypothetical protein ACRDI0_04350 [Actinomycetota bacterium]
MSDGDTQVKELLQAKAEEMRLDPRIPGPVLRRARLRRVATAVVAGAVAVGVALGGVAGLRAALVAEPPVVPGEQGPWEGIWPQDTRAEAEEAQAAADAGDPQAVWQLDGEQVIRRYGTEVLEWEEVSFEQQPWEADALVVVIGNCPQVATERCPFEIDITIERLVRTGPEGIYVVTGAEVIAEPDDGAGPTLRSFVRDFMNVRRAQAASALADLISAEALAQYERGEGGLSLNGPTEHPGFTELTYEIVGIEAVDAASYEVAVRITERFESGDGSTYRERLFVGPGQTVRGDSMPLVIRGAMRIGSPPEESPPTDAVRDFVAAFMEARLAAQGAEDYLGTGARLRYQRHEALWDPDQPLYLYGNPHPEGHPAADYAGYRIEDVRPADAETCGWFEDASCQDALEVVVVMDLMYLGDSPPGTMRETLIVAPSDGAAAEFADWMITAAARGEEPPGQ